MKCSIANCHNPATGFSGYCFEHEVNAPAPEENGEESEEDEDERPD